VVPMGVDGDELRRTLAAVTLARDLVNTPANRMGPADLTIAVRQVAEENGAAISEILGEDLLAEGFPMIHAVGAAAAVGREPRLLDLTWGDSSAPKVTLVGKGVCFDTGGLDIKPSSNMILMKKDMGGAANALALASMIMGAGLPVRLRLLIPAVENAISGAAFRPGDILESRKGLSVEIGNTDAEGRLVLADALTLASEEIPDLLVDFATLTGAARVALGPDVPAVFTTDDALADELAGFAKTVADPSWRLPLWSPYASMLESKVADINNAGKGGFAGAITAALFLKRFVGEGLTWLHADIFAWNQKSQPARPEGGEAQTIRSLFALLKHRYPPVR
jgi:leucyl aminopeptidase